MTRWARPRVVIPVALLAAGLVVISGRRIWLTGRVDDAKAIAQPLDDGTAHEDAAFEGVAEATTQLPGHGGEQTMGRGQGLVALALVLAAGTLAAATAAPVVRRITLITATLAAGALAALSARAMTNADSIVGSVAAQQSGRSGSIPVAAEANAWPAAVLVAMVLTGLVLVAALASAGSWRGLSERYDPPGESDAAGGRGERVLRTWDRLDRGDDPTLDETAP